MSLCLVVIAAMPADLMVLQGLTTTEHTMIDCSSFLQKDCSYYQLILHFQKSKNKKLTSQMLLSLIFTDNNSKNSY